MTKLDKLMEAYINEADIKEKKKGKALKTAVGGLGIGAIGGTMAVIPNVAATLGIPHALGGKKEGFGVRAEKLIDGIKDPAKTKLSKVRPMQRGHERTVRVWSKAMGIEPPTVTGQGKVNMARDMDGMLGKIGKKIKEKTGTAPRIPAGAFYNQRKTPQGTKHIVSVAPGWEKAIAHEVGHAKAYSKGPLRTKLGSLARSSGKVAPFIGAGMLASDNEKVNKAAPAAAGIAASGAVASEINANKNIYTALRNRGIRRSRAFGLVAKRQTLPLATYAAIPAGIAGATYFAGKFMKKKKAGATT